MNQVTKKVAQNQSHCMVPTLEQMLERHHGATRANLEWLINHEIMQYAIRSLGKAPLSRDAFKGFRVNRARLSYAALTTIALSPPPLQNALATARTWAARNILGRK